ncbi:uncharacterized protein EI90DRAFT_3145774 [Cantharellus anzutake]|uniref:uncharacterized protein n=1 Tax=Cantharellus anzutake TaxID=1750568 RepID=UPI00190342F6|nr:uncharacterized protein EI90DRAFT_3145774 [Cantharellus anzutake]KAF8330394.1 hypothetical protein EI90DRAFT_3145774 [Cantharellus anzutake]
MTRVSLRAHFLVLSLINEERNSYGLRLNEYGRYREHCSRKISKLRQKLKLTHGKGKKYTKTAPIPTANLTDAHLQLLLFEAERSWTYSQQLSSQRDPAKAIRQRATGRLRRAVHSAAELRNAALILYQSQRINSASLLEIFVYHFILEGRFHLRKDDFQEGVEFLSVARFMLDKLTTSAATSHDQALYTLFSDEIAPQIRYGAHSLGRSKAYDIDSIVNEVAPRVRDQLLPASNELFAHLSQEKTTLGEGSLLREILWEGVPVPMRSPELVDAFLKVQKAEDILREGQKTIQKDSLSSYIPASGTKGASKNPSSKSSKSKIAAYDDLLLALSDAEEVSRRLVEARELFGSGPISSESGVRDINFIHAFIGYRLLSQRIERDLLLVDSLTSHQKEAKGKLTQNAAASEDPRLNPGLVKLYDAILQSLERMRTLSIVDESINLVPAIEAKLSYSKARRLLYLSRAHSSVKKYAETLALTAKAHIYLREMRSHLASSDKPPEDNFYPITLSDIASLKSTLFDDEKGTKSEWFSFDGGRVGLPGIDQVPHKKPLFFDVAFNYIELPFDRLQARAQKAPLTRAVAHEVVKKPTSTEVKEKRLPTKIEEEPPVVKIVDSASYSIGGILGGWWGRK